MITFRKDPGASLDYTVDWTKNLRDDDELVARTVTVPAGLNKGADALTTDKKSVVVWLSGGTVGNTYPVTVNVTSAQGMVDEVTFGVLIAER